MSPTIATRNCVKSFFVVANGVHVEQALRRVCVATITGIDYVNVAPANPLQMLGNQIRRTV